MKKLTYLTLSLIGLVCILVACGGNAETDATEETTTVETPAVDTTAVDVNETATDSTAVVE